MKKQIGREHCVSLTEKPMKDVVEANLVARALFSRALAELKYLGMIKNSRKKADHLAKLSWIGL